MRNTPRKTPYVAVNLTIPARDTLKGAVMQLTSDAHERTGRRLTISEFVIHAVRVVLDNREAFLGSLTRDAQ